MESGPFSLLSALFADEPMTALFSETSTVQRWLETEAALAAAQAETGTLTASDAEAIAAAAVLESIDLPRLWREARNVGYPILPLVRMVAAALPEGPDGRVHYGATTQDIMDTGLALQLRDGLERLAELLQGFGDVVAGLVGTHRHTVMPARTHAQQAVPTTLGAKLAVLLDELARHRARVAEVRGRVAVVSLHGAGGTSAALGVDSARLRAALAARLGLGVAEVPWHVARDRPAEFGALCALLCGTCARFAREVVDLSRTEIAEVTEQTGHLRGASSTMPQKANPIGSEAVLGMSITAGALASALYRAQEAGHERAAGEWQAEWQVLPQLAGLAAGALATAAEVAAGLRVHPAAMRANLRADGGLVMAEAYMMRLAPSLGRERAHDLVYEAARRVREDGGSLEDVLPGPALLPEDHLGDVDGVCDAALSHWEKEPG